MKVNVNERVRFKPTPAGKRAWFRHHWKLGEKSNGFITKEMCVLKTDSNGYAETMLWEFMAVIGPMYYMGASEIPTELNEIEILIDNKG